MLFLHPCTTSRAILTNRRLGEDCRPVHLRVTPRLLQFFMTRHVRIKFRPTTESSEHIHMRHHRSHTIQPHYTHAGWAPLVTGPIKSNLHGGDSGLHGPTVWSTQLPFVTRASLCTNSSKALLTSDNTRTRIGARAFRNSTATLWNNLLDALRHCDTLDSFRSRLKTHLYKAAYEHWTGTSRLRLV